MKLSINLNKIALLRNARGEGNPSLEDFANRAIDLGVSGLTLHPRPDHRHATSEDVISSSQLCKNRQVEFNIEGNPFSMPLEPFKGFVNLVKECQPDQITLVPDLPNQITSDHGWEPGDHDNKLKEIIYELKAISPKSRVSLFVDSTKNGEANIEAVDYAALMGANSIEIHTGYFAQCIAKQDFAISSLIKSIIQKANQFNILVNAGHDLNLLNLPELVRIGGVDEVSIGHAIIVDALNFGFDDTIKKYIDITKG
ncbi:pyridoxine 5'-phosphate synthase [Gammaproteobacteria bacterium]|nr:pyridoxine 5'-phosphate synthase [Gammaproteobacteria bacterium]